jgi:hypothetical protein
MSYGPLRKHYLSHVGSERKANLILGPVKRSALAARVGDEAESVLDSLKSVRAGLWALYDTALSAGDGTTGAMIAGRLHENLGQVAKLTGQLIASPLVQNTTINNTLHASPEYLRLRDGLLQLIREHPEVRPALFAMLKRLDSEPTPEPTPTRTSLLIEQERHASG